MPEKNPEDDFKMGSPEPPGEQLLVCERALGTSERKLSSMLELGRLIGLDLNLDDMLIQIASKAKEVLEADRFNLLLYDRKRMSSGQRWFRDRRQGVPHAIPRRTRGVRLPQGQTVNVEDAHEDPRFSATSKRP